MGNDLQALKDCRCVFQIQGSCEEEHLHARWELTFREVVLGNRFIIIFVNTNFQQNVIC